MSTRNQHDAHSTLLALLQEREEQAEFLFNAGRLRESPRGGQVDKEAPIGVASPLSLGGRTPLHDIFGHAQLLEAGLRGPLTEAQRDDIGRVRENERHLLNLVDAVIDFARWDQDEPADLEDVVVRDALRFADLTIARYAWARRVTYDADHAGVPADLVVRADFRRLAEILRQLLQNAVKFSRSGGAVVVRAMSVGECVWIRVSDTGIGIDEEDIALIFHPLVRGRDPYARAQEGLGMGLAITRKLAESMHGELSVVSAHHGGSTFTIALPQGRRAESNQRAGDRLASGALR